MYTIHSLTHSLIHSLAHPFICSFIHSVQFDGQYVVSGAYDFLVKIWDPVEGTCLHTLQGHTNRVYSLLVSYNI